MTAFLAGVALAVAVLAAAALSGVAFVATGLVTEVAFLIAGFTAGFGTLEATVFVGFFTTSLGAAVVAGAFLATGFLLAGISIPL